MESPQSNPDVDTAELFSKKTDSAKPTGGTWYICKYRRLTDSIKKINSNPPADLEVFFPFHTKLVKRGKTSKKEDSPILPGYIFVKGFHDKIVADELFRTLPLLRHHTDNSYITVSERQMDAISRFVRDFREHSSLELETLSIALEMFVVPEEYDYVEIVKGPYKGRRGYFKTKERSKHGTFFFDLETDDKPLGETRGEDSSEFTSRTMQVVPAIQLSRSMLKILKFAPHNGHARDFLNKAYNKAISIYERIHAVNEQLTLSERETIAGYVICYGDVEAITFKQRTNLQRLLLVCYAILNSDALYKQTLSHIEDIIYPDFEAFVASKRKNKEKEAANAAYKSYKESVEKIHQLKIK